MKLARSAISVSLIALAVAISLGIPWAAIAAQTDPQGDWLFFEDSVLRFKYPPKLIVASVEMPGQAHLWDVSTGKPESQIFIVHQYRDGKEKRALNAIVQALAAKSGMKIFSGPTKVVLSGGECLKYRQDAVYRRCEGARVNGWPTDGNRCIIASSDAVCYSTKKIFFKITSAESWYATQGKPDAQAQQDFQTFDTILKSLTFK
ncbi:MAG: hypothetical protein NTX64_16295 [Elusimicrobia bacterium]|nr:hypothetical protein [Elusimicrobiota bacterium]